MRTNNKKVRDLIRKHLIENITDYGNTINEAVENIEEEFNGWYCEFERQRTPNRQEAFISWAWGLPTCYNSLWETHKILEFMEFIGLPLPENKEPSDGCDLYMVLLYSEYQKLKSELKTMEVAK